MKSIFKVLLCICALSVSGAGAVHAGPMEDGVAAFYRDDYGIAFNLLRPFADRGEPIAQSLIGAMYSQGNGAPRDIAEAGKWFQKSANQGEVVAQFMLGVMYANGDGVPVNYVQSYKWYNLAAAQGNADSKTQRAIIEKKMSREQIAEAQKLSAEWKPTK